MSMYATIKLRDICNKVIASTEVTDEHYLDVDPDEFVKRAWKMADQMATQLADDDEWRLTLKIDLDMRETIEEIMAKIPCRCNKCAP